MSLLIYSIPVIAVIAAAFVAMRFFRQNGSGAKALKVNFAVVALVFAVCMFGAMSAMASGEDTAEAPVTTTAAETTAGETENVPETTGAAGVGGLALGLGLLAAALSTSISGIGGGIAVASAAPAAIGATSEDPKAFGKALIFVALGESIALYGLVIAIMILNKI